MANLWFFYALGASILWGLRYVVAERVLKTEGIEPLFLLFASELVIVPVSLAFAVYLGQFKSGVDVVFSNSGIALLILLSSIIGITANCLILSTIDGKNATLAALVEITYPFFYRLFCLSYF